MEDVTHLYGVLIPETVRFDPVNGVLHARRAMMFSVMDQVISNELSDYRGNGTSHFPYSLIFCPRGIVLGSNSLDAH